MKNHLELVNQLEDTQIPSNYIILISLDVVSLFTTVPTVNLVQSKFNLI